MSPHVDEYITKKQTAAMRFHRNHRLMLEVFGEASIPDTRHVVTKNRLLILKKQVQSLQLHQVSGGVGVARGCGHQEQAAHTQKAGKGVVIGAHSCRVELAVRCIGVGGA